jgi:hypothetical protein
MLMNHVQNLSKIELALNIITNLRYYKSVQGGAREQIFFELIRFVMNMRKVKTLIGHKGEVPS